MISQGSCEDKQWKTEPWNKTEGPQKTEMY